ncbi:MAG TPA: energy-dependent translational throttle protein EttA, partial [Enorma massiliensis]|uniref:energy-dependent translational throttle protein EttA n=1 Tax=Enorma massiliensis TaxID=1472761 RepID=UPI001D8D73ED
MAEFIYQMYQARKAHGDKVILDDVTLSFYPGAKIGVVGPNGMGKSTLLKIMAGKEEVSNGDARLTPGYTVGLLEQEPPLDDDKTVIENVRMAFGDLLAKVDRFNKIGEEMAEPDADFDALMAEMGKLQDEIDAADGWDIDSKLGQAMDALQLPDSDMPVKVLSGGERRRVALCKLLLEAPDLLLLDEPTNHLDAESVLWLEHFLKNYQGAVLAVTHDRYFLDNVAEWICEVDRGHLYPYKGNYSTYLETKAARVAAQGQRDAKLAKRMASELEWVRSSPKARQAKNKARLARYEEMEAEARASQKLDWTDIRIPVGPRLGAKVLEVEHLHKEFDGRVLIDDLSFSLPRNGIVGVIGPNGVGKSTLFKMIIGEEKPTSGAIELGETVKISYVDQGRAGIDADKTLWEVVSGGTDKMIVGETEVPSRAYVASFGFKGQDQQKRAGVLSGGERNRLNLALTLKQGGNLLLLDEPTNDLDVETLSSLEAALL